MSHPVMPPSNVTRRLEVVDTRQQEFVIQPDDLPPVAKLRRIDKTETHENQLPTWVQAIKPPTRGWRYFVWWLYTQLRLYKLSWIREPQPFASYAAASRDLHTTIMSMRQQAHAVVVFLTNRGKVGKTTIATWFAMRLNAVTLQSVCLIDTDREGGKASRRFGYVGREVATTNKLVEETVERHNNHIVPPTYSFMLQRTATDPFSGVMLFHALAGRTIVANDMATTINVIKENVHTLVLDTGAGLRVPTTHACVQHANVRVIPANGTSEDDLNDVQTMLSFDGYNLKSRLSSIVIVISALPKRDCTVRQQHAFAKRFNVRPWQIVLVPFNRYLADAKQVMDVALDDRTRYAFDQLAHAITQAAVLSKHHTS